MTRPKVPPDQRQRTAQACEVCKRRKQKCNGLYPCNTCEKRKFNCTYSDRDPESPGEGPPLKRVHTEGGVESAPQPSNGLKDASQPGNALHRGSVQSPLLQSNQSAIASNQNRVSFHQPKLGGGQQHGPTRERSNGVSAMAESDPTEAVEAAARSLQHFSTGQSVEQHQKTQFVSGATSQSGHDEEAIIYSQMRMLQDPTGRLLYVGDSASLSFLQLLRMMVENVSGPSAFTVDPRRHKITETPFSLPPSASYTHLLPDKKTARVLVESFFVNTHGFMQVFDRQAFLTAVDTCFADPLNAEPPWLCLLNLVFAIGLMLALPRSGTDDAAIVERLQTQHTDRAEVFYLNAKSLNDPLTGFEDADFWSVQALLLMSYYMLVKSKRNTAFALLGMAVRSAYALGLHREETMIIFSLEEQAARRNLWKSLFVMDRFLSFSLGRPTAISEDDCSGDTLRPSPFEGESFGFDSAFLPPSSNGNATACALEAAVRSCSVIGRILKQVYQQRKISTRLAQEIADICKMWPKALAPSLHWRKAATATPSEGIAILHANLFYCHSIVLLTRPFFLYIMNTETQRELTSNGTAPRQKHMRMEKFSEACVIASTHTVVLVQNAFEAGYLPRRNPAVVYFLFAAALVLLANEFAVLYTNQNADQCIQTATQVIAYCADSDSQASRLLHILMTFQESVYQQRERRRRQQQARLSSVSTPILPQGSAQPIASPAGKQTYHAPRISQVLNPQSDMPQARQAGPVVDSNGISPHTVPATTAMASPNQPVAATPSNQPNGFTTLTPHASSTMPAPKTSSTKFPAPAVSQPASTMASPAANTTMPPELNRGLSLSNLLDLSALDSVGVPSIRSDESTGPEELIDFDALWAWPSNTPAVGSPRAGADVQGVSDSAIPLFGVYDR